MARFRGCGLGLVALATVSVVDAPAQDMGSGMSGGVRGTLTIEVRPSEERGYPNLGVREGPAVDGKRHGRWILRGKDGAVGEGPYVDHWVKRYKDGNVAEGPYVDGKRHGTWVDRGLGRRGRDGACVSFEYSAGKFEFSAGKRDMGKDC